MTSDRYDLIVVGATASGLSVAISSKRSGVEVIRVLESTGDIAFGELASENQLDVGFGETVQSVDLAEGGDHLIVTTNRLAYATRACLVANRVPDPSWAPPTTVPDLDRVLVDEIPDHAHDQDVLVVGYTDHAVELVTRASADGARVVMAAGGMDPAQLSPAGASMLRRLERDRRATLLYRSVPDEIGDNNGFPIAYFNDRRVPDLEFDYVIFATGRTAPEPASLGITPAALDSPLVWFVGNDGEVPGANIAPGWEVGTQLAAHCYPELEVSAAPTTISRRARHEGVIEELREEHYNATITQFEPTHSDLWVLRVRPDNNDTSYVPGQYASLGLGFWEDRIDDAVDDGLDDRWEKLIRRSYSISHPIFDQHGYLASPLGTELEFYIVLVRPTPDNVPALTPRLALKRPGDRIYLGPKVAGRYTLNAVTDPTSAVVFLATGTGEAPHNAMITELLRKGHTGPIVSAVTVRYWVDLGYRAKHEQLMERFANYRYLPLPTREQDTPKRYIQDLISSGELAEATGGLDPQTSHVYLCGNPAMIGLPEGDGDDAHFPETTGVVELLTQRGFRLDKRGEPGNIHYEEYW